MKKRQEILSQESQQFADPKLQEKLTRFSGVSPHLNTDNEKDLLFWLDHISNHDVSEEQRIKLKILLKHHISTLKLNYEERGVINKGIQEFYKKKNPW